MMATYLKTTQFPLTGTVARIHAEARPKRVVRGWVVVLCIFVGMVGLTMSAMIIGKLIAKSMVIELPPQYLPGNPPPNVSQDLSCSKTGYDIQSLCSLKHTNKPIILKFHTDNRQIIQTTLWNYEYRVGDMIAAWGTPTGIARYGKLTYLYWRTRAVFVHGKTLRPTSFVESIEYFMEQQQGKRWRGFTN
jgi:hypothetical protein